MGSGAVHVGESLRNSHIHISKWPGYTKVRHYQKLVVRVVAGQALCRVQGAVVVFCLVGCLFVGPATLHAGLILTFSHGDSLDGHVAGSTADFLIDGQSATLTTRGVVPSGSINTTSGALGINASGSDTADRFDDGESWVFDWSIDTLFEGVDFQLFSTATEQFSLQSDDWIGLSVTPTSAEVAFDDGAGRFTFTAGDSSDDFDFADLTGGTLLPLTAGSDLTLGFTDSASGSASLQSLTFASNTSVPEPRTLVLTAIGVVCFLGIRRRIAR